MSRAVESSVSQSLEGLFWLDEQRAGDVLPNFWLRGLDIRNRRMRNLE